jgi:hypothetical protein
MGGVIFQTAPGVMLERFGWSIKSYGNRRSAKYMCSAGLSRQNKAAKTGRLTKVMDPYQLNLNASITLYLKGNLESIEIS